MSETKGKNFSANNVGGKRKKSDLYETPYSISQQFIDRERDVIVGLKTILEPSAGNGAMTKVLENNGFNVVSKDISIGEDFLKETERYDGIITNPPFSLAFEFIQKAKTLTDYFAFLLPLSYLHGKKRHDEIWMDKEFPLSRIYVFTRYVLFGEPLREDGKYSTGMITFSWFVWDKFANKEHSKIYWIDNNEYILNKEDKKCSQS